MTAGLHKSEQKWPDLSSSQLLSMKVPFVPSRSPAQSRQGRLRSTGQGENSKEYSIAEVKEMFPKEWHRFVQKTGRVVAILQVKTSPFFFLKKCERISLWNIDL